MRLADWFKRLLGWGFTNTGRRPTHRPLQRRKRSLLRLERLEDRIAPAFDLTLAVSGSTVGVTTATAGSTTTFTASATGATLVVSDINAQLGVGQSVVISTGANGTEAGDINTAGFISTNLNNNAGETVTLQSGTGAGLVGDINLAGGLVFANSGALIIQANHSVTFGSQLSATTIAITAASGSVDPTNTSPLVATDLSISAATGIGDTTAVETLADNFVAQTASGGIHMIDQVALTIGFTGEPFAGVTAGAGDISLESDGTFIVNEPISSPSTVRLVSLIAIAQTNTGVITANSLGVQAASGIALNVAGNAVNNFSANNQSVGDIDFDGVNASMTLGDTVAADSVLGTDITGVTDTNNVAITNDGSTAVDQLISAVNVTLISVNDAITEGGGTIDASTLAVEAFSGIGSAGTPLTSAVGNLVAQTNHGGIFIDNTGDLTIGFIGEPFSAVLDFGSSGDVSVVNTGTVFVTTSGEPILSAFGNVTVDALGATSDIVTSGNQSAIGVQNQVAGATVTLNAGRDLLLGNNGQNGDVEGGGSESLTAGRNVVVDNNTLVAAFGTGALTVVAGAVVTLQQTSVAGAQFRGDDGVTIDATGAFIANGGGKGVDTTEGGGNGNIIINAGSVDLTDPVTAGTGSVTLTATTTSILGAGKITAGDLALGAQTGIGPLTTAVGSLVASSAAGTIDITNAGALDIGFAGAPLSGVTIAANGDVTLQTGGNLNITQPVAVSATNTVRLFVNAAITQTAAGVITAGVLGVQAQTGIDLSTADNAVDTFTASPTISTSSSGAFKLNDKVANLTLGDTVTADAPTFPNFVTGVIGPADVTIGNAGDITIDQALQVGAINTLRLSATGQVTQLATGDITATSLGVSAGTGILLDTANFNTVNNFTARDSTSGAIKLFANALTLTVGDLVSADAPAFPTAVTGVTGPADVTIGNAIDLVVDQAVTAAGTVRLNAITGSITQLATGVIKATALGASGTSGIDLSTADNAVSDFTASNTSTGTIDLTNSAANLALGNSVAADGAAFLTAITGVFNAAAITVTNAGAINVVGIVHDSGSGDVTLTATDLPAAGQNLTVAAAGGVFASTGNILLQAGDNITIAATAQVEAGVSGVITITGDFNNADTVGGSVISVAGSSLTASAATINGGAFADTFDVSPSPNLPITVNGGGASAGTGDTMNLDLTGDTDGLLSLTGANDGVFIFSNVENLQYNSVETANGSGGVYDLVLDMHTAGFQDGSPNADQVQASLSNNGTALSLLAGSDGATPGPFFSGAESAINSLTVLGSTDPTAFNLIEAFGGFTGNLIGLFPSFAGSAITSFNGNATGAHSDSAALHGLLVPANASINFQGQTSNDTFTLTTIAPTSIGFFPDLTDVNAANVDVSLGILVSLEHVTNRLFVGHDGTFLADATLTSTSTLTVADSSVAGGGLSQIVGDGGFGTATFGGFDSFVLKGGTGSQSMTLASLDSADHNLESVTLSGDNAFGTDTAANSLAVQTLPLGITASLQGGGGDDIFNIGSPSNSLTGIDGSINIDGNADNATPTVTTFVGSGSATVALTLPVGDVVNVNDQGDSIAGTYNLDASSVVRVGTSLISLDNVQTVNLNTSPAADTINVGATIVGTTNINNAGGHDIVGITTTAAHSLVKINAAAGGSDTSITGTGAGSIVLIEGGSGTDRATLIGSGSKSAVRFDGNGGTNTMTVQASGSGSATVFNGGSGTNSMALGGQPPVGGPAHAGPIIKFSTAASSLGAILGTVSFNGGTGVNNMSANDSGASSPEAYSVSGTELDRTGAGRMLFSRVTTFVLGTTQGAATVNVSAQPSNSTMSLIGGNSNDAFKITVNTQSKYKGLSIAGGNGANRLTIIDPTSGADGAIVHNHPGTSAAGSVTTDYPTSAGSPHDVVQFAHVATVSANPNANASYVNALLHEVLNRAPKSLAELNGLVRTLIADGRLVVANQLENTKAAETQTVIRDFAAVAKRQPTTAQINKGVAILAAGGIEEQVFAALFPGSTNFNSASFHTSQVIAEFVRLLHSQPTSAEIASIEAQPLQAVVEGFNTLELNREKVEALDEFFNEGI